jgi:hypothetical protein
MLLGIPRSARCVQRFDDSLNSAIHITYRISLRSSSMREPRDPLLKVVLIKFTAQRANKHSCTVVCKVKMQAQVSPSPQEVAQVYKEELREGGVCTDAPPLKGGQQQDHPSSKFQLMILPQVHLRKPCYDFYFL